MLGEKNYFESFKHYILLLLLLVGLGVFNFIFILLYVTLQHY